MTIVNRGDPYVMEVAATVAAVMKRYGGNFVDAGRESP